MIRWKMLEGVGAYVAGELSGEEARKVERLILEDPEALALAESYTRLLAALSAVGRESPVPPPALVDHAVRSAVRSGVDPTSPELPTDVAKAGQEDTRKEGLNSED